MKRLIKLCTCLLLTAGIVYGQTTPPTSVVIEGNNYYQHGHNKDGANQPQEARDSVTVTSVIKYFVLPDPGGSPNYNPANAVNFSDVNSTFTWSLGSRSSPSAFPALGTTNGSTTPLVEITWGNVAGIDSIWVREIPITNASCAGAGNTIPVAVINKPNISFTPDDGIYADSACYTLTEVTAGVTYNFDMTVTTQSSQIWVDYTVTKNGVAVPSLDGEDVPLTNIVRDSGSGLIIGGTIPLIFNDYGVYEVTITKVTDRVSRKSTDAAGDWILGTITSAGAKFTYSVMLPVRTGPIFRIPNNF